MNWKRGLWFVGGFWAVVACAVGLAFGAIQAIEAWGAGFAFAAIAVLVSAVFFAFAAAGD